MSGGAYGWRPSRVRGARSDERKGYLDALYVKTGAAAPTHKLREDEPRWWVPACEGWHWPSRSRSPA